MRPSGLLIFGTSHVGKSALAAGIGEALGARVMSTDRLGRHPGRPWPQVRPPVAEYYSRLTDETIYWFLRVHHENLWPIVHQTIAAERFAGGVFVVEGSALRPEFVASLEFPDVLAVGLYADAVFLRRRIEAESGYAEQDERQQALIARFVARSLRDNDEVVEAARRLGLQLIDAADPAAVESAGERLAAALGPAERE